MSSTSPILSRSDQSEGSTLCATCGSSLAGPYCSKCGERVIDPQALTVKHFLSQGVLHEFTHLDGKIFRTFRFLLFRPGFLSAEYFAGRRRLYVNPVRLLLTAALIFAVTVHASYMSLTVGPLRLNLLPPGPPAESTIHETLDKLDMFGVLSHLARWRAKTRDLTSPTVTEKFHHEFKTYGTALSFGNVILLALFLFAIYRRRRPLFLEHLIFSLHMAAFVLLFSIFPGWLFRLLLQWPKLLGAAVLTGAVLVVATEGAYLYLALLRFYGPLARDAVKLKRRGVWKAGGAVVLVFLANSVFITLTYTVGAAIALLRI